MTFDAMVFEMFKARRLDPRKTSAEEDYARAREDVDAYVKARDGWADKARAKIEAQK
jgi:hypothetical protein